MAYSQADIKVFIYACLMTAPEILPYYHNY